MANWVVLFLFCALSAWGVIVLENQEARKAVIEQEVRQW